MSKKIVGIGLILMMVLSGCDFAAQYQSMAKQPTPTREIIYMDDPTSTPYSTPYPQILPSLNPTYLAFGTHLQVVRLANDDGTDLSTVTDDQIMQWVNEANLIFAQASLRFLYDPSVDASQYKSTLLNHVGSESDPNWSAAIDEGRKLAQSNGTKTTVLFRNPTLEGDIGSWQEDFILMPSVMPDVCGKKNITLLAHQIGHYLGLSNTFPRLFGTVAEAEGAYQKSGFSSNFFDGDGLTETPPDPYVNLPEYQCGDKTSITVSNAEIPITMGNLMSYYATRDQITPQQIIRLRFFAALRTRNGSLIPSNQDAVSPIQFEDLKLSNRFYCDPQVEDISSYYKRGWIGGSFVNVPAGYGSICTYKLTLPEAGRYEMVLYATKMPDYGVVEISLDGWMLNDGIDLYSMYPLPTGPVSFGLLYLDAGDHELSFKVIRKDVDALNYNFGLDALTIQPKNQ